MTREKILVIDDSEAILSVLAEKVLLPEGYKAITANNGRDGLALALTAHPDLVLLDLDLPDLNGLEIMKDWQDQGLHFPVIILTGHGSERMAVGALRLGVRDYIVKPFTAEEILDSVARALTESRLRRDKEDLTAALQHRVQQLSVLYSAGKAVASLLEPDALLSRIVELSIAITGAEEGYLALREGEEGDLYIRATKNLGHKDIRRLRLKARDDTLDQVLETGKPLRLSTANGDSSIKIGYMARALLQVPIQLGGHVIGVLSVDNQVQRQDFTPDDEEMLSALADHAAVAIVHARLYEALRTSEQQYRSAIESSPDALAIIDNAYCFTFANAEFARITGYTRDELVSMDFRKLIAPEQMAMVDDYYLRRQRGETVPQRHQVTILTKQGTRKELEIETTVRWDENGRASTHVFLRGPQHQAIQDKTLALLTACRDTDTGLCLLDNQGRVEWANQAMLTLANSSPAELIGHPLSEALNIAGTEDALTTALEAAARGTNSQIGFAPPGGEAQAMQIQLTCLSQEEEKHFLGVVCPV
jgi:two-component system NtrC family sensor kinase